MWGHVRKGQWGEEKPMEVILRGLRGQEGPGTQVGGAGPRGASQTRAHLPPPGLADVLPGEW